MIFRSEGKGGGESERVVGEENTRGSEEEARGGGALREEISIRVHFNSDIGIFIFQGRGEF